MQGVHSPPLRQRLKASLSQERDFLFSGESETLVL